MFDKIEKTDMACYWLDFMTMVEILMMNVYAIHTCNWDEFITSISARDDALDGDLRSDTLRPLATTFLGYAFVTISRSDAVLQFKLRPVYYR
jgi:hypothetical protein